MPCARCCQRAHARACEIHWKSRTMELRFCSKFITCSRAICPGMAGRLSFSSGLKPLNSLNACSPTPAVHQQEFEFRTPEVALNLLSETRRRAPAVSCRPPPPPHCSSKLLQLFLALSLVGGVWMRVQGQFIWLFKRMTSTFLPPPAPWAMPPPLQPAPTQGAHHLCPLAPLSRFCPSNRCKDWKREGGGAVAMGDISSSSSS
jgi:hypothetical protein